nr:hypothetical protein [Tanacetum cinerariifolium]
MNSLVYMIAGLGVSRVNFPMKPCLFICLVLSNWKFRFKFGFGPLCGHLDLGGAAGLRGGASGSIERGAGGSGSASWSRGRGAGGSRSRGVVSTAETQKRQGKKKIRTSGFAKWPSDKLMVVFGHGSDEKKLTLEEICAEILRSLKEPAESYLDTTANFERLNRSFFGKCIEHAESCLLNGHMHKKGIDNVVLVGGSTGIPKVKQMPTEFFKGKRLFSGIMPQEVVAFGAAVLAANLGGIGKQLVQDLLLLDAAPLSLGIGLVGDIMSVVIPRNKIREKRFLNTSELDGIPADRAGAQKLKVSFKVSAVVKCNGNKRSLTIAKSGN